MHHVLLAPAHSANAPTVCAHCSFCCVHMQSSIEHAAVPLAPPQSSVNSEHARWCSLSVAFWHAYLLMSNGHLVVCMSMQKWLLICMQNMALRGPGLLLFLLQASYFKDDLLQGSIMDVVGPPLLLRMPLHRQQDVPCALERMVLGQYALAPNKVVS
eukprot:1152084-Pelagomonas_calceolata.AAC.15